MDYANREFRKVLNTRVPVNLLDERRSTICGVQVDLHNYIRDDRTRREITEKLENIMINVTYQLPRNPEFEQRELKLVNIEQGLHFYSSISLLLTKCYIFIFRLSRKRFD